MANIRTLTVSLTAKTERFRKGMKRAVRSLSDFADRAKLAAFTSGKVLAAGGAAATLALTLLTKRALESADAISKLSDRSGFSTESVVALTQAGEIYGLTTQQMSKSLEQFTRRLGEAQGGTGEAKDALELMGLTAEELAKQQPIEALKLVADRIQGMTEQTLRAEAAYGLFGRTGIQMVNILQRGGAEITAFEKEARDLGLTFDRLTGSKIELANDSFTRLSKVIGAIGLNIAVNLAPLLAAIGNALTGVAKRGQSFGASIGDAINLVVVSAGAVIDKFNSFRAVLLRVVAGFKVLQIATLQAIEFVLNKLGDLAALVSSDLADIFERPARAADAKIDRLRLSIAGLEAAAQELEGSEFAEAFVVALAKGQREFEKMAEDALKVRDITTDTTMELEKQDKAAKERNRDFAASSSGVQAAISRLAFPDTAQQRRMTQKVEDEKVVSAIDKVRRVLERQSGEAVFAP